MTVGPVESRQFGGGPPGAEVGQALRTRACLLAELQQQTAPVLEEQDVAALRLQARSLTDVLVVELREQILDGRIAGGTVLTETEVASEYEVARPTAKAAIERLTSEGLLRRDAHRSARVPVFGAEDVVDLYFARTCLERQVMRELAKQRQVPAEALEAQAQIRRLAEADDTTTAVVEPDVRFHGSLIDALGSPRLSRTHASITAEMRLCNGAGPDVQAAPHRGDRRRAPGDPRRHHRERPRACR